jgi:hypothetical protein
MAMTPSDDLRALRARVLAAAAATPSPTRKQGRVIGIAVLALSPAIAVVLVELEGGLAHGAGRPRGVTTALVGGWLLVSVLLTSLVARRRGSSLTRRSTILTSAAVATPLLLFAWMHAFYGSYDEPFARVGYRCLALTLLIAATPLAGFMFLRRGIEPRHPMAIGSAVGAACGAWAGVVVDLWCPLTNVPHVLFGHVLPLVVLIAGGALIGARFLGIRRLPLG